MRLATQKDSTSVLATTTLTTSYQATAGTDGMDTEYVDFMVTYTHDTGTSVLTFIAESHDDTTGTWHAIPAEDTALVMTDWERTRSHTASGNYVVPVPTQGHQVRLGIKTDANSPTVSITAIRRRGV